MLRRRRSASFASSRTKSTTPLRNSGSPPVRRIFLIPNAGEYPRHTEVVGERQVAVQRAFVASAAVDTLVVAAIGDRDPEIGDGAAEFVGEGHGRWSIVIGRWPGCHRKFLQTTNDCFRKESTLAGLSQRALPFQYAPHEAREARAFPPAPLGECGAGTLARVIPPSPPQPGYAQRPRRSETRIHYRCRQAIEDTTKAWQTAPALCRWLPGPAAPSACNLQHSGGGHRRQNPASIDPCRPPWR